jgi:hypothetical protein
VCAVAKLYNVIDDSSKAVLAIARSVAGRGVTWCVHRCRELISTLAAQRA